MMIERTAKTTPRRSSAQGQEPDPPSLRTLAARRREAEATLEAIDAQQRAAYDAAEAADAQERAAREGARPRTAELSAELYRLDRYAEELRQREYREWHQDRDRRQAAMDQLRALADEPLPHVPMTRDEQRELLAELDAALAAAEHEGDLFYHGGRLWDRSRLY
jgi:hypothetical protein